MKATPAQVRRADAIAQVSVRVLAILLCVVSVVWVLIDRQAWPACLILAAAAIPLAILGGER